VRRIALRHPFRCPLRAFPSVPLSGFRQFWLREALRLRKERDFILQVLVRDNNIEQALRVLKKKLQREGVLREMRARRAYEKPSEKRAREKADAIRRSRKLARKQAQREGLLPAPKKRVAATGRR